MLPDVKHIITYIKVLDVGCFLMFEFLPVRDDGEAGAAVRQLHVHILEQIDEFVAELRLPSRGMGGEELLPFVTIRDSWANINPRGR